MNLKLTGIKCAVFAIFILQSCSHVTYNAGFTVPNDKDEYIPSVLGSILFNNPKLSKIRICEYDSKKYLVLIQGNNSNSNIQSTAQPQVNIFDLSQIKNKTLAVDRITYFKDKKTKYAIYVPAEGEDELSVFYQLSTLLNSIKKNKNIELYSTTGFNGKTKYIVLFK